MLKSITALALAVALVSSVMVSVSYSVTDTENPCKADIKRLCGHVQQGQGRVAECLKAHKDDMSKECKDWMASKKEQIKKNLEAVQKACSGDIKRLCPGVEPGEGRIMGCLMKHKEEISPECKASMGKK